MLYFEIGAWYDSERKRIEVHTGQAGKETLSATIVESLRERSMRLPRSLCHYNKKIEQKHYLNFYITSAVK